MKKEMSKISATGVWRTCIMTLRFSLNVPRCCIALDGFPSGSGIKKKTNTKLNANKAEDTRAGRACP